MIATEYDVDKGTARQMIDDGIVETPSQTAWTPLAPYLQMK